MSTDTKALTQLSPLRNTTSATTPEALAKEQLEHFGIDGSTEYGQTLERIAVSLYNTNAQVHDLWKITADALAGLDRSDRIAYFNAKRFVCFQIAKMLDTLQNPMRATYQSIAGKSNSFAAKGPFPLFDNVTALFSATPVVTRTATYLYACTEWVEDAFTGREPLHEIYSRLLNPTSISLANHIVDIECGPNSGEYLAWNFNSGMAAIDGLLANLVGYGDVVLSSRNVYGGTYQLLHDWYGKKSNLDVGIEWFDAIDGPAFEKVLKETQDKYAGRLAEGRRIYVYLESPCNPHGNILDVAAISKISHEAGCLVMADTTVGTPFLSPVMRHPDPASRPDFTIHSYTKDLSGGGATTAGVVIGRNERMFMAKGDSVTIDGVDGKPETINWDETMFWNVYYIKGAFLDADKAFEVLNGMKTYEMRVLNKAINTATLARLLSMHPNIRVNCPAVPTHENHAMMLEHMFLGLPAGLFTMDFDGDGLAMDLNIFKRFFDSMEPAMGLQVTLGQNNTTALCPALTSHSEMSAEALAEAGISPTTIRVSVGLEDPRVLIAHMKRCSAQTVDATYPGFSEKFPSAAEIDSLYRDIYMDAHDKFLQSKHGFEEISG